MKEYNGSPDSTNKINNLFGLQKQGRELINQITQSVACTNSCLLFLADNGQNFTALSCVPKLKTNKFSNLKLSSKHTIAKYLRQTKKLTDRKTLSTMNNVKTTRGAKREQATLDEIELAVPLISRERLMGIMILGKKSSGAYSLEDYETLQIIAGQVATSMEKEYLREQLTQRTKELAVLYAEVTEKSRIDSLTGLLNRRSLDETIASEINRHARYGGIFSVILLDVDSLGIVNDSYGHLTGDEALRQIGSIIKNAIRTSDQAFRYGGDEFAILLPNTPLDGTYNVAERVRKQIATKAVAGQLPITASLGMASWPVNGKNGNEIIGAADAALYRAKRRGGNQIEGTAISQMPE